MATKVGRFAGSRNKGPLVVVLGYTGDFFVPSYVGRDYITRIPVEQAPCQTTSMIGSKRVFLFNTWPFFYPKRWRSPFQPLKRSLIYNHPKRVTVAELQGFHGNVWGPDLFVDLKWWFQSFFLPFLARNLEEIYANLMDFIELGWNHHLVVGVRAKVRFCFHCTFLLLSWWFKVRGAGPLDPATGPFVKVSRCTRCKLENRQEFQAGKKPHESATSVIDEVWNRFRLLGRSQPADVFVVNALVESSNRTPEVHDEFLGFYGNKNHLLRITRLQAICEGFALFWDAISKGDFSPLEAWNWNCWYEWVTIETTDHVFFSNALVDFCVSIHWTSCLFGGFWKNMKRSPNGGILMLSFISWDPNRSNPQTKITSTTKSNGIFSSPQSKPNRANESNQENPHTPEN